MALCFVERELLPIEGLQYWNRDFSPLGSCDLDLDPITFKYTRPVSPRDIPNERKWTFASRLSKDIVLQAYIQLQTDRLVQILQKYIHICATEIMYHAARFACGQKLPIKVMLLWKHCKGTLCSYNYECVTNVWCQCKGSTHYPCSGAMNTGREPGCLKWPPRTREHGYCVDRRPCSPMSQTSTVIPWTRPVNKVVILDVRFHGPWIWAVNMGSVDRCAMFFNTANAVVCGD